MRSALLPVVSLLCLACTPGNGGESGQPLIGSRLARSLPESLPAVVFADVTGPSGLAHLHSRGPRHHLLPEDMGSGLAWGDFDRDGFPDLYIVNQPGPWGERSDGPGNRLFRNRGDGTFEDITKGAGVGDKAFGMGATWADIDGDGWLDLYVTNVGANRLYRNRGDGTFVDITDQAGVGDAGWGTVATWGDIEGDGDLDLYVGNYVTFGEDRNLEGQESLQYGLAVPFTLNPYAYPPEQNRLFINQGNGTFTEEATARGVADPDGRTLAASFTDLDGDGWLDLYVANDLSANALYHNRGDGTFQDLSAASWTADFRGAMGVAVGDPDGDGDLDLFITHWVAQENALFRNLWQELATHGDPALRFVDSADDVGLGQSSLAAVGWGAGWLDLDRDGHLDLVVVNGHTLEDPTDRTRLLPQQPLLFWQGPDGFFYEITEHAGPDFSQPVVGRGLALADYDRDGDLDMAISANRGPLRLLRNETKTPHHWISINLSGHPPNPFAIGARISLYAGGRLQVREIGAGSPYLSQHDLGELFGLGDASRVDSIRVRWPTGEENLWVDLPTNRVFTLHQGKGGVAQEEKTG